MPAFADAPIIEPSPRWLMSRSSTSLSTPPLIARWPVKELLRSSLQGYLGGDRVAYGKLLHIAELADQQEVVAKKGAFLGVV